MATPAQITANRANARLSTGPRTVEGKALAAVAANGRRHGLSGTHFALLPEEDPAEFESLFDAYTGEFAPVTPAEEFLVREMVQADLRVMQSAPIPDGV